MAKSLHPPPAMRLAAFILFAATAAVAADETQLALSLKAQSDFDRVQMAAVPQLHDTSACIQSQAALLPIASRTELPLIRYRKGFCSLLEGTIRHEATDFASAAADFDAAVQAWPARIEKPPKGVAVEPVSSALPVLATIARLEAQPNDLATETVARTAIDSELKAPACPASVMPADLCQRILQIGRQWLGWMDLRANNLDNAVNHFSGYGWTEWVAGRQAFQRRNFALAAQQYRKAIDIWQGLQKEPAPTLEVRLGPVPDIGLALADLGGAQLLQGNTAAAIATLDASIKIDPEHAWSFYLRGRAKDIAGQAEAALADYNLASRTAFAGAKELASGEAHLYRGIVYYRRRDYQRAEDEFSSALNFEIPADLRPDAVAWRRLAAVAGGACTTSRAQLRDALPGASPYFPAKEAQAVMDSCPATAAMK